jgi:hypothetical protein
MIETFIKKNKQLLQTYYIVACILGWANLVLGVIGVSMLIAKLLANHGQPVAIEGAEGTFLRSWSILIIIGLISLGVAQFIKYLFNNEYRPGWLLRHGDKTLYLFAFFMVWRTVGIFVLYLSRLDISKEFALWLLILLSMLLLNLAKILALIAIAQILKRVMPIIEEAKSLV